MTPSPNTPRFEKLANFLEQVMTDSKASRRVRLSAAMRLDDLLKRQQAADAAKARSELRTAQKALEAADPTDSETDLEGMLVQIRAEREGGKR